MFLRLVTLELHICIVQLKCRQRPLPFLTSNVECTVVSCSQRCLLGILCSEAPHTLLQIARYLLQSDFGPFPLNSRIIMARLHQKGWHSISTLVCGRVILKWVGMQRWSVRACRVTRGKAPPFSEDLSLTYLFASTSEKSYMWVTNYMLCVYMTEYHMRRDNMSAENRLLIAALKMSPNLSCGAKRPGAYDPI